MIILSFIVFLVAMTLIGVAASKKSLKTSADYILANRSIGPMPTALSAVSTCHSGFMFIGLIGFTYQFGISAIWLVLTWLLGDYVAWLFIHPRLRQRSQDLNSSTIAGFISCGYKSRWVKKIAGIFIFIFLTVYAAAQLSAGSKALTVMLSWPDTFGIIVGAIIVTIYSFSGGVRASIWTDVAQSVLMLLSMTGLIIVCLVKLGGISGMWGQLLRIDPNLVSWIPSDLAFGFPLYIIAWVAFGLGVVGQPHIMARPMAISNVNQMKTARRYYFLWYLVFAFSALGVGLSARILLPGLVGVNAELALPLLSQSLLPDILVGGILAGLFSATISTADSQVISCSSAITQDIYPKLKNSFMASKLFTLLTMFIAVIIALFGSKSVFVLVILGWSGCAVVLGPLIFLKCFKIDVSEKTALAMMLGGLVTIVMWSQVWQFSDSINETLPGLLVAMSIFGISKLLGARPYNG